MEDDIKENFLADMYFETKSFFADRLSSPLISSFVISWLISNYQVILIIFADTKINHKLKLLNWYFHTDYLLFSKTYLGIPCWLYFGILIPISASYLYIYQFPKIGNLFALQAFRTRAKLSRDKSVEEKKESKTPEQVEAIHEYYRKINGRLDAKIKAHEITAESQQSVIDSLETQLKSEKKANLEKKSAPTKSLYDSLSDDQIAIIDFLGKNVDEGRENPNAQVIQRYTKLNNSKIIFALDKLINSNYIKDDYYDGVRTYELTSSGLNVYIDLSTPPM